MGLLFPTLISACHNCPSNLAILQEKVNKVMLVSFLKVVIASDTRHVILIKINNKLMFIIFDNRVMIFHNHTVASFEPKYSLPCSELFGTNAIICNRFAYCHFRTVFVTSLLKLSFQL